MSAEVSEQSLCMQGNRSVTLGCFIYRANHDRYRPIWNLGRQFFRTDPQGGLLNERCSIASKQKSKWHSVDYLSSRGFFFFFFPIKDWFEKQWMQFIYFIFFKFIISFEVFEEMQLKKLYHLIKSVNNFDI